MSTPEKELRFLVESHLQFIYDREAYPDLDHTGLATQLIRILQLDEHCRIPPVHESLWSERDIFVITYGDTIIRPGEWPLRTLHHFLHSRLRDTVSGVHILPFFPYSSDDGFAVIDYTKINDSLGDWRHIEAIADDFDLMADLVINHCSSRGQWFENFKRRRHPGKDYFVEVDPLMDISVVVRARNTPLLREVETLDGSRFVWCTFGHDQVDLNFANPDVLCKIARIIKLYLDRGIRVFRLDAVAFVWKEAGTRCINHPKTHEIIRLVRTLVEHHSPDAIIITETNVPNHENLSYFGNANEAHAVYNFSLPPLLLHALVSGSSRHLKAWQMSMPQAQEGTLYFNFIASHDGIGLRPVEGLLSDGETTELIESMERFGGRISWRTGDDGRDKPYEINITLYEALQGTLAGPDRWQLARFLCAHAIMLSLEGIPAIYIQSLFGTGNHLDGVALSRHNRTINRYKWSYEELETALADNGKSHHARVFRAMQKLIRLRRGQPAFHPNGPQFTLHLGDDVFGFWRQSPDRRQIVFCIHNITDRELTIPLTSVNLTNDRPWADLIGGSLFSDQHDDLILGPYEFVWLTQKDTSASDDNDGLAPDTGA
jgi:sucrose phosphorylase